MAAAESWKRHAYEEKKSEADEKGSNEKRSEIDIWQKAVAEIYVAMAQTESYILNINERREEMAKYRKARQQICN